MDLVFTWHQTTRGHVQLSWADIGGIRCQIRVAQLFPPVDGTVLATTEVTWHATSAEVPHRADDGTVCRITRSYSGSTPSIEIAEAMIRLVIPTLQAIGATHGADL